MAFLELFDYIENMYKLFVQESTGKVQERKLPIS